MNDTSDKTFHDAMNGVGALQEKGTLTDDELLVACRSNITAKNILLSSHVGFRVLDGTVQNSHMSTSLAERIIREACERLADTPPDGQSDFSDASVNRSREKPFVPSDTQPKDVPVFPQNQLSLFEDHLKKFEDWLYRLEEVIHHLEDTTERLEEKVSALEDFSDNLEEMANSLDDMTDSVENLTDSIDNLVDSLDD